MKTKTHPAVVRRAKAKAKHHNQQPAATPKHTDFEPNIRELCPEDGSFHVLLW